jgi:hypothetical protein
MSSIISSSGALGGHRVRNNPPIFAVRNLLQKANENGPNLIVAALPELFCAGAHPRPIACKSPPDRWLLMKLAANDGKT